MARQKKNLKTVSVHSEYTDLILKIIKKAKISRVRVPLRPKKIGSAQLCSFLLSPLPPAVEPHVLA
jgi:hypothetical protein